LQRRGCCPLHGQPGQGQKTFSVHPGKRIFQCFEASCGVHGNVLDLWTAVRHLPLSKQPWIWQ
jgi:DNA primase